VPTAYPQIAKALNDLANNIPKEINLEIEKGYALTTDFPVWLAVCIAAGVIGIGLQMYATYYGMTGALDAKTTTILVGIGGAITFFGRRSMSMGSSKDLYREICSSYLKLYRLDRI